jgi:hypothetical protein
MSSVAPSHVYHTPFKGSVQQRANLEKLCEFVESRVRPDRFDMLAFDSRDTVRPAHKAATTHPCGTSACFAGYGPQAGVRAVRGESWFEYAERAFTDDTAEWDWLFSDDWASVAGGPEDAISRARYLLTHGLPHNSDEQRWGEAEPTFKSLALPDDPGTARPINPPHQDSGETGQ